MKHEMDVLVTRDEDGTITIWGPGSEPYRDKEYRCWDVPYGSGQQHLQVEESIDWFPDLTWASEPVAMTLTLEEE